MSAFTYDKLDSDQIRVLEIKPSINEDSIISCILESHELKRSDVKHYTALSYTWGSDEQEMKIIRCNGKEFPVTVSLFAPLQRLRARSSSTSASVVVWVDAICINQNNSDEKAIQIGLMREIYENATETFVWLGQEAPGTNLALDALRRWASMAKNQCIMDGADAPNIIEDPLPEIENNQLLWDGMANLFERSWWSRTWVVQELCLSKDPVIAVGKDEAKWEMVWDGILFLGKLSSILTKKAEELKRLHKLNTETLNAAAALGRSLMSVVEIASKIGCRHAQVIGQVRHLLHDSLPKDSSGGSCKLLQPSLLDMLVVFCSYSAKDPRDKVYGLLGMCDKTTHGTVVRCETEYSIAKCYVDTALSIIRAQKDLSILNVPQIDRVPKDQSPETIPSWVPHWNQAKLLSDPEPAPIQRNVIAIANTEERDSSPIIVADWRAATARFNAAGEHNVLTDAELRRIPLPSGGNTNCCCLPLSGCVIDSISELQPVRPKIAFIPLTVAKLISNGYKMSSNLLHDIQILRKWRSFAQSHLCLPKQNHTVHEGFMSSILSAIKPNPISWTPECVQVFFATISFGNLGGDDLHERSQSMEAAWKKALPGGLGGKISDFVAVFHHGGAANNLFGPIRSSFGRRIAWTIGGRFALVPASTEIGDNIVVVGGGKTPYVVRRMKQEKCKYSGKHWTFVGDAYVHDIMFGEAWDDEKREMINLC